MLATYDLDRGFALMRLLDAPPDVVFEAWTDPAYLYWFFNPGFTPEAPTTVDLRVGGQWRQQMIVNADTRYITGGVYREIVPNQKLVFTWGAVGGWPELDLARLDDGLLATVTLTPIGNKTEMEFRLQLPDHMTEDAAREWLGSYMQTGWGETIDRLVARLAAERATV